MTSRNPHRLHRLHYKPVQRLAGVLLLLIPAAVGMLLARRRTSVP